MSKKPPVTKLSFVSSAPFRQAMEGLSTKRKENRMPTTGLARCYAEQCCRRGPYSEKEKAPGFASEYPNRSLRLEPLMRGKYKRPQSVRCARSLCP